MHGTVSTENFRSSALINGDAELYMTGILVFKKVQSVTSIRVKCMSVLAPSRLAVLDRNLIYSFA